MRVQDADLRREALLFVVNSSRHRYSYHFDWLGRPVEPYAPLVTPGSDCVVFDTIVEDMPKSMFPGWPWNPGNNPKTAVHAFLATHPEFSIDADIHNKLLITVAPDGYLRCSR